MASRRFVISLLVAAGASLVPLVASAASTAPPPLAPVGDDYTIDSLDRDTVVLRTAISGNGWGNDRDPLLAVYADGSVYIADDSSSIVGGYRHGQMTAAGLERLLGAAEAAALLDVPDYGDVLVTDVGSTVVSVDVDQGSATHSVWALGIDDEPGASGLDSEQAEARRALSSFLTVVDQIVADTVTLDDPTTFVPDELYVSVRVLDWDSEFAPIVDSAPMPWPLAEPFESLGFARGHDGTSGCATLTSDDAAALYAALGERLDSGQSWVMETGADDPAFPLLVTLNVQTAFPPMAWTCSAPGAPVAGPGPLPETAYVPLTGEIAMAEVIDGSPWPVTDPSDVTIFERMAAAPAFFEAASVEVDQAIDSVEASWFDVVAFGGEIGGVRNVIFRATCSSYIADEYDRCELWGRFDVKTGQIVDVEAR